MVNKEQIIFLLKTGLNFSQVSKQLRCSRNTVKSHFWKYIKYNSLPAPNLWQYLTDNDKRIIKDRKLSGDSAEVIANDFGICKSYVYKIVKKWS